MDKHTIMMLGLGSVDPSLLAAAEGDYFGALQAHIIGKDKLPRVNKEAILRTLAGLEYDFHDAMGQVQEGVAKSYAVEEHMRVVRETLDGMESAKESVEQGHIPKEILKAIMRDVLGDTNNDPILREMEQAVLDYASADHSVCSAVGKCNHAPEVLDRLIKMVEQKERQVGSPAPQDVKDLIDGLYVKVHGRPYYE